MHPMQLGAVANQSLRDARAGYSRTGFAGLAGTRLFLISLVVVVLPVSSVIPPLTAAAPRTTPSPSAADFLSNAFIYRAGLRSTIPLREDALFLAREAFRFTETVTWDSPSDRAIISDPSGGRRLIVLADRSFLFSDTTKLWNRTYRPRLPSEADAVRFAVGRLGSHGLLPMEATALAVEKVRVRVGESMMDNHWRVVFGFRAVAGRAPAGDVSWPVHGATLVVRVGGEGEVIGVHWRWRPLERMDVTPLLSPGEAQSRARWRYRNPKLVVSRAILFYSMEPEGGAQDFVYPAYLLDIKDTDSQIAVPATPLVPIVRIAEPPPGARLPAGKEVKFRVQVLGGSGDFTYRWTSSLESLAFPRFILSDKQEFGTVLRRKGAHFVTVVVRDARGLTASDELVILVQ